MKYKVGDKVRVKSIKWYNKNKDEDGNVPTERLCFVPQMAKYCGKEATILDICKSYGYNIDTDNGSWWWNDDMLENVRKEESR